MQDFRKLSVWEKAHRLTLEIYLATVNFPQEEVYGLTSQIRRASASIPANIAEGCGREGRTELARFLQIAQGSASELQYHLLLACDLKLLDGQSYEELNNQLTEVRRMLTTFTKRIKTSDVGLKTKN